MRDMNEILSKDEQRLLRLYMEFQTDLERYKLGILTPYHFRGQLRDFWIECSQIDL